MAGHQQCRCISRFTMAYRWHPARGAWRTSPSLACSSASAGTLCHSALRSWHAIFKPAPAAAYSTAATAAAFRLLHHTPLVYHTKRITPRAAPLAPPAAPLPAKLFIAHRAFPATCLSRGLHHCLSRVPLHAAPHLPLSAAACAQPCADVFFLHLNAAA